MAAKRKYDFVVRFAVYNENYTDKWWVSRENVCISAENIWIAKFKAIDFIKQKYKGRNPWLDEAISTNNFFTNVQLIL